MPDSQQRYTDEQKAAYVQAVLAGKKKADIFREGGPSEKALRDWVNLHRAVNGDKAAVDSPSRVPTPSVSPSSRPPFAEEKNTSTVPEVKPEGLSILVIPDAHASPSHHNARFTILGKFIVERQPDIILSIGDWADLESLCSYDRGKRGFEGRRYHRDIDSAIDAQQLMLEPIAIHNAKQRAAGLTEYAPRMVLTLGNHENRISRVVEDQPELHGTISYRDLKYEEHGWEVYPFLRPVDIQGVLFAHYFTSGVMGRAISGESPAKTLVTKRFRSSVCGHSHLRDFSERTTADGKRVQGLVVGCYLDIDQHEAYAGEANLLWWRGLVMLHDVRDGWFEPEFISMHQLRRKYAQ